MQVWLFASVEAEGLVDSLTRSCLMTQDTRVHRAAIHAIAAALKSQLGTGAWQWHEM